MVMFTHLEENLLAEGLAPQPGLEQALAWKARTDKTTSRASTGRFMIWRFR
jgi:hypothetical protein